MESRHPLGSPAFSLNRSIGTVWAISLEQLQHLLTDATWDPLALDEQRVQVLAWQLCAESEPVFQSPS